MSYVQQHVAKFAVDFCYRTFAARAGVLYGFVEVSVNALLRGLGAGGGGRAVNKIGNFWRGPRQRRRPRQVRRPRQGCAARASGAARANLNGAAQRGVLDPDFLPRRAAGDSRPRRF